MTSSQFPRQPSDFPMNEQQTLYIHTENWGVGRRRLKTNYGNKLGESEDTPPSPPYKACSVLFSYWPREVPNDS